MKGLMRQDLYSELFKVEDHHWWHKHKRGLVKQYLKRLIPKPGKILDVGAGTGKILAELKNSGWQVFGVDGEKKAVNLSLKRGVQVTKVNLSKPKLPFRSNHFDAVITLDTLEHLADDLGTLKEIKRVVKPKGIVIITVPAYPWLFSYWDEMLGHYRRYTKSGLIKLSKQAGLELVGVSHFYSFLLLPAIVIRKFKQQFNLGKSSDFNPSPGHTILFPLLEIFSFMERTWLKYTGIPAGLSLVCVLRKK